MLVDCDGVVVGRQMLVNVMRMGTNCLSKGNQNLMAG